MRFPSEESFGDTRNSDKAALTVVDQEPKPEIPGYAEGKKTTTIKVAVTQLARIFVGPQRPWTYEHPNTDDWP